MMFRRLLRQRRPFQNADSEECWRSSASAAGKPPNNNNLSWSCVDMVTVLSGAKSFY